MSRTIGREEAYRDLLAINLLDAGYEVVTEHPLPFGYADVKAYNRLIEVEFKRTWRHGVRQALGYAWQEEDAVPAIAIIGRLAPKESSAIYAATADYLDLLLLDGCQWHTVQSPTQADREWIPAEFHEIVEHLAKRTPDELDPVSGFRLPRARFWYANSEQSS